MFTLDNVHQIIKQRTSAEQKKQSLMLEETLIDTATDVKYVGLKAATSNVVSSGRRHRGQWFRPEYDFKKLQIAQHTDGIILRAIKKKADRILLAGFNFVGVSDDPVQYIKNRIKQIELVSNKPFNLTIRETVEDLLRQGNSVWTKVRSQESSSGAPRTDLSGKYLEPVAAYYILPMDQLEFKTKVSGELKKLKQVTAEGATKEFSPSEVIHFYTDKKAGFTVGTPDLLPALDDIALLRRIEENVEELIETNLFPSYHYKVGNDAMPERYSPEGVPESVLIKRHVEYMPAGSVYVSDHRHEIIAIGSEGKALTIDMYLEYFKKRAIASAGATEIDLGMSGDSNRSTANTLSKSMIMDIEALIVVVETFINFFVISELLLEGGYDPFDPAEEVRVQFGVVDRETRMALENQQIQMFSNKVRSLDEVRASLGDKPVANNQEWLDNTYYKLFEEPLSLSRTVGVPGSAGTETLAALPSSNITPKAVSKEKQFAKQTAITARAKGQGRKPGGGASGAEKASAAKSRPSNQTGTRAAPKLNTDYSLNILGELVTISLDRKVEDSALREWTQLVCERYEMLKEHGVSADTLTNNLLHRLN